MLRSNYADVQMKEIKASEKMSNNMFSLQELWYYNILFSFVLGRILHYPKMGGQKLSLGSLINKLKTL